jgi:hypothetical protein
MRFERSEKRSENLRALPNIQLIETWEHECKQYMKDNPDLVERARQAPWYNEPLKVEDALKGGLCSPFKLFHECAADEVILGLDIISLYPWVSTP